jgi:6-phosphofructokinase 1
VLGYVQRGGTPTARDRVLATRFGIGAIDAVKAGDFGQMAALRGNDIVLVPIADAVATLKTVPPELYAEARTFFG